MGIEYIIGVYGCEADVISLIEEVSGDRPIHSEEYDTLCGEVSVCEAGGVTRLILLDRLTDISRIDIALLIENTDNSVAKMWERTIKYYPVKMMRLHISTLEDINIVTNIMAAIAC